jgi:hypothetical protein
MRQKLKWLSRKSDGRHFKVGEKAHLLPKKFKNGSTLVHPKVKTLKIADLKFREEHPVNLEPRVAYFIDLIRRNYPIPPISVQRQKDGSWLIYDGHARTIAFQREGFKEIQATVAHPSKMRLHRILDGGEM